MKASDFISRYIAETDFSTSTEAASLIADASFRNSLYGEMTTCLLLSHATLLRELIKHEMRYRDNEQEGDADDSEEDFFENIYWCAFLLYRIGDVQDVTILWRAKNVSFDTYCGFDIQFLVGAGIEATLQHLNDKSDTESQEAQKYILKCVESGDFLDVHSWFHWRTNYFR